MKDTTGLERYSGITVSVTVICVFSLLFFLSSCLYTTKSYNHGIILKPGISCFNAGFMPVSVPVEEEHYYFQSYSDTTGFTQYTDTSWVTTDTIPFLSFGIGYQLGILEKFPLGNGLEMGWLLEFPISVDGGSWPALDLHARFGIHPFRAGPGVFYHNVALGWLVGQWIDNSWYLEYAAGWEWQRFILYANARGMLTGTVFSGDDLFFGPDGGNQINQGRLPEPDRSWLFRFNGGIRIPLWSARLLPDYVSPEISVLTPLSDRDRSALFWSVGFEWEFR